MVSFVFLADLASSRMGCCSSALALVFSPLSYGWKQMVEFAAEEGKRKGIRASSSTSYLSVSQLNVDYESMDSDRSLDFLWTREYRVYDGRLHQTRLLVEKSDVLTVVEARN